MRPLRARGTAATSALVALLALSGCATNGESGASGEGGDGVVVTSLYPVEYVADRIAGDHLTVTNLVSPGREPHDLELSVRQTAELSDADVAVHLLGFQPAVDEAIEQNGPAHVVELSEAADLRPADPHFWLDPVRMAAVAEEVEQALAEAAPDHADDFAANLDALLDDLAALDADYRDGLAECRTSTVVVSHDAFGYLAKYGLDFAPIAGLSPGAEPSPAHLAELGTLAREEGVTTIFTETLASPEMAETLAAELDLRTAVLDPLEGLSEETSDEDYLSLMRANLEALRTANGCS